MTRQRHYKLWGYEDWLYDDGVVLIKRICANQRLSVQVHLNEETAKTIGGKSKVEMWCVLKDGPIFAGLRPGVGKDDILRAVEDGSFEKILVRLEAKVGECYLIPGGLVHAIGEGTSVFEVQQSSDTTFRFYDWGRLDVNGKPRELHVKNALAAMDLSIPSPVPIDFVECKYFSFKKVDPGVLSPNPLRRVIYDPLLDSLTVVEPLKSLELPNLAFEVLLP